VLVDIVATDACPLSRPLDVVARNRLERIEKRPYAIVVSRWHDAPKVGVHFAELRG
jgi:hypothetical protein